MLAAGAGLPEGEALGLFVSRIDFLRSTVAVEQQVQRGQLVPLKTGASRRTVRIDDFVLAELAEHLRKWPACADGFVVTNRCVRPAQRGSFNQ